MQSPSETVAQSRNSSLAYSLLVLFILFLALCFRVHGLQDLSLWIDEYYSIPHNPAATFSEHMSFITSENPDHVPVYFAALYGWSQLFGMGLPALRMFSILLALPALFGLYLFMRRFAGHGAAALALLLVAMSPEQIWHAQLLRSYSLILLLFVFSMWGIYEATGSRSWKWWLAHGICNALGVFTHMLFGFVIVAQGIYLLLIKASWRTRIAWGVFNLGAGLAAVSTLPVKDTIPYLPWHQLLSPLLWIMDLFGDDAASGTVGFLFPVRLALLGMVVLTVAIGVWHVLRAASGSPLRNGGLLLICLAFIPLIVVTLLSLTIVPIGLSRYTLYSSWAVYGLAALGVTRIGKRFLRISAGLALVLSLSPLLLITLVFDTRPDTIGVAKILREEVRPGDAVRVLDSVSYDSLCELERLRYHLGPSDFQLGRVHTMAGAAEEAAHYAQTGRTYWFVDNEQVGQSRREHFAEALEASGLKYENRGVPFYTVWKIRKDRSAVASDVGAADIRISEYDYTHLLELIGQDSDVDLKSAEQVLERTLDWPGFPEKDPEMLLRLGLMVYVVDEELGRVLMEHATSLAPDNALILASNALCLAYEERYNEALPFAERLAQKNDRRLLPYVKVVRLASQGDIAAAGEELMKQREMGHVYPGFFDVATGISPTR